MATSWQIGDKIQNRWEIYKILKGGMGIVYIVYDHEHRDAYAAKTFQDEVFAKNLQTADLFTREALAWVNLDVHQNVTRARFVEKIEGKPFLFLEYVSGGDLRGWVGTPRLTEDLPQVLRFAIQFCDGMMHALSKGIKAHRDIKPSNCLITQDRTLKVTDFGLARAAAMQEGEGGRGGTPEYMPAEQWDNFEQADERADVYSFGVMLYEMLAGKPPFGKRPWVSVDELERRHKEDSALPFTIQNSELRTVVETCLAKDPTSRFADFRAVRERLAKIYERLTGEPTPQPVTGSDLDAMQWDNKGVSLDNLGHHAEAVACYDRALTLNSRLEQAWSNKGAALVRLERHEEAIACFDRALALNPRDEHAWSNRGVALGKLGRHVEKLVCSNRALDINPHFVEAWLNKGAVLGKLGRRTEELVCYNRALEIDPRSIEAWFNKGVALGKLGRHQEALACSDRALEISPGYVEAWFNKGAALHALGRHQEALTCFDRVLTLRPRFAEAWSNKGVALTSLGQHQEALTCFDHALVVNPRDAEAWYNKGLALGNLGRPEEALACFEEAQRLGLPQAAQAIGLCRRMLAESSPTIPQVSGQNAEEWLNRGIALTRDRRWEEAITCYDHALALNPGYERAWFNKGAALGPLGRMEEAVSCFEHALELNPLYIEAWSNSGVALRMLGRWEEAIACYDRSLELNPHSVEAWFNKGLVLVKSGRLQEALACFVEAQRLGYPQAAEMIAQCRQALGQR